VPVNSVLGEGREGGGRGGPSAIISANPREEGKKKDDVRGYPSATTKPGSKRIKKEADGLNSPANRKRKKRDGGRRRVSSFFQCRNDARMGLGRGIREV